MTVDCIQCIRSQPASKPQHAATCCQSGSECIRSQPASKPQHGQAGLRTRECIRSRPASKPQHGAIACRIVSECIRSQPASKPQHGTEELAIFQCIRSQPASKPQLVRHCLPPWASVSDPSPRASRNDGLATAELSVSDPSPRASRNLVTLPTSFPECIRSRPASKPQQRCGKGRSECIRSSWRSATVSGSATESVSDPGPRASRNGRTSGGTARAKCIRSRPASKPQLN